MHFTICKYTLTKKKKMEEKNECINEYPVNTEREREGANAAKEMASQQDANMLSPG